MSADAGFILVVQEIFGDEHVVGFVNGDGGRSGGAEPVEVDGRAQLAAGVAHDNVVECAFCQRAPLVRCPKTVVIGAAGDHRVWSKRK